MKESEGELQMRLISKLVGPWCGDGLSSTAICSGNQSFRRNKCAGVDIGRAADLA
jgi:hypothetical protein